MVLRVVVLALALVLHGATAMSALAQPFTPADSTVLSSFPLASTKTKGVHLAIIYPNAYEYELNQLVLFNNETVVVSGRKVVIGDYRGVAVAVTICGLGMLNAAMTTQMLLDHFAPTYLLLCGVSGGISRGGINVGQVVVAERWMTADHQVWTKQNTTVNETLPLEGIDYSREPPNQAYHLEDTSLLWLEESELRTSRANSPNVISHEKRMYYDADPYLLTLARSAEAKLRDTHQASTAVHGVGASASTFLDHERRAIWLYDTYNVTLVDMETSSVAFVCATNRVPFLGIRAVSDLVDRQVDITAAQVRRAALDASRFLRAVVDELTEA